MTAVRDAHDEAEAVRQFTAQLAASGRRTQSIQVRLDGEGGMTRLCAVEAALAELCPSDAAKELVWLTRATPGDADVLHLRALGPDGEVAAEAAFRLSAPVDA